MYIYTYTHIYLSIGFMQVFQPDITIYTYLHAYTACIWGCIRMDLPTRRLFSAQWRHHGCCNLYFFCPNSAFCWKAGCACDKDIEPTGRGTHSSVCDACSAVDFQLVVSNLDFRGQSQCGRPMRVSYKAAT